MKRKTVLRNKAMALLATGLWITWCASLCMNAQAEDLHAGHDHEGDAQVETETTDLHDEHGDAHDEHTEEADEHAGHAHEEAGHSDDDDADSHEDHEVRADAHAGHEGHEGEDAGLRLTDAQRKLFGIVVRKAGPGSLLNEITVPGQVAFNEDRLAHLVPRSPGIAIQVHKSVGDTVNAGEPLALIDSIDLAEARMAYISAVTELGCCQFELPRAQAVHDNTLKLLALLDKQPLLEQLGRSDLGEMGSYRSKLVSVYAELVLTKTTYVREQKLLARKISSEGDFLNAENSFKKAQAEYVATRDSVAFEVKQTLLEATRDRQLVEFEAQAAKQKLHVLGLSQAEVDQLAASPFPGSAPQSAAKHACTDPNCASCKEAKETGGKTAGQAPYKDNQLGWYVLRAPFDGVIVQKHISLGERVEEDSDVFAIADTREVWVNLTVYTKHLGAVQKGQLVVLRAEHSGAQLRSRITMVTPFVEEATRSATARVKVDNADGRWIPGTFVTGFVSVSDTNLPVVIPRGAVQSIEGQNVVFIEHEGALEPVPVVTGKSDRTQTHILSGLEPGTPYVAEGAFEVKATVITSTLGSHAGHGH